MNYVSMVDKYLAQNTTPQLTPQSPLRTTPQTREARFADLFQKYTQETYPDEEKENFSMTEKLIRHFVGPGIVRMVGGIAGAAEHYLLQPVRAPLQALGIAPQQSLGQRIWRKTGDISQQIVGDKPEMQRRSLTTQDAEQQFKKLFVGEKRFEDMRWDDIFNTEADVSDVLAFIAQHTPQVALALATMGKSLLGHAVFGGGITLAQNAADTYNQILDMPQEVFNKNPQYQTLVERGVESKVAKNIIAQEKADLVGLTTAPLGALGGAVSLALPQQLKGSMASKMLRSLVLGATANPPTETGETFLQNLFAKQVDPEIDELQGLIDTAMNAFIMGGTQSSVAGLSNTFTRVTEKDKIKYGGFSLYDRKLAVDKELREKTLHVLDFLNPQTTANKLRVADAKALIQAGNLGQSMFLIDDLLTASSQESVIEAIGKTNQKHKNSYTEFLVEEMGLAERSAQAFEDAFAEQERIKQSVIGKEKLKADLENEAKFDALFATFLQKDVTEVKEMSSAERSALAFEERFAEQERMRQSIIGKKKLRTDLENQTRFNEGEQGNLILEQLDKITPEQVQPITEQPIVKTKAQLEMLTAKTGRIKKDYIKKVENIRQNVEEIIIETPETPALLEKVGLVVDKLKGYEAGSSARVGRSVNNVIKDLIVNPINAALLARQINHIETAQEAEKQAVHFANELKKEIPEVAPIVDKLMLDLIDATMEQEVKPIMPVLQLNRVKKVKPTIESKIDASAIIRQAIDLDIPLKEKSLEELIKEIRDKQEELVRAEISDEMKTPIERTPVPKELLLPQLKKIIANVFTDKKGYDGIAREKVYNKTAKLPVEQIRKAIKNMQEGFRVEKEEETFDKKQALIKNIKEGKELRFDEQMLEAPEKIRDISNQDLTNVKEEKLNSALQEAALWHIKNMPITGKNKQEWTKHVTETFKITEEKAYELWNKAFKQFEREKGLLEKEDLENFVQDNIDDMELSLHEFSEGVLAQNKFGEEIENFKIIKEKVDQNALDMFASHEEYLKEMKKKTAGKVTPTPSYTTKGDEKAFNLKNFTSKADSFLYYLTGSTLSRDFAQAIFNSKSAMTTLEMTNTKVFLNSVKRSNAVITSHMNKAGETEYTRLINLHIRKGETNTNIELDIMHEINHILGMTQIRQNPKFKAELQNLIDTLEATLEPRMKMMLKRMRDKDKEPYEGLTDSENAILYSLTTPDEFFAGITSDLRMQDFASKVKYNEPKGLYGVIKSVWEKFISLIKAYPYEGKIEDSVLDSALKLYATIIETPVVKVDPAQTIGIETALASQKIENFADGLSQLTGDVGIAWKNLKKVVRVPVWNETLKPLVKKLYEIQSEAHRISFTTSQMLHFLKPRDVDVELQTAILESDAAGKKVGYDNLSPQNKVKFDTIRNTLNYIVQDQMKQFYIKDETFKQERKLKRKLTLEEGLVIEREADTFLKKHFTEEYFPRFRFGNQALVVKDKEGKTIFFGTFDSTREMNRTLERFFDEMGDVQYESFDMRERFKDVEGTLFALHNSYVLENMLKSDDASSLELKEFADKIGSEFLRNWAGGRFAHRQEAVVAGYETNIVKSLHKYIETFPKAMVGRFLAAQVEHEISKLPENEKQYGRNLVDFFNGKILKEGKVNLLLRTILYNAYFMLKPAFAIVNLSQRLITTIPKAFAEMGGDGIKMAYEAQKRELSFYTHQAKKWEHMYDALDTFKEISYEDRMILKNLIAKGTLAPLRTHEIVEGSKIGKAFSFFATTSEKSNRLMSAFTALSIGHKKGLTGEAFKTYVEDFIEDTQFLYSKANRARLARGILAPVMMFKSFVLNDLNFLASMYPNKKAFGMAVAMRLSLGGVGGIYGSGAFMFMMNVAMSSILGDDDWQLSKKEFKNKFPRWFTNGLPTLMGISGSSMFGSSELFGTALAPYAKALYGIGKEYIKLGEVRPQTWRRVLPSQAKHLWRLNLKERFQDEDINRLPREVRQRVMFLWKDTPREQQTWEVFLSMLGFATDTPSQFYEAIHAIKATGAVIKARKTQMSKDLARALQDKDYAEIQKIREKARKKGFNLSPTSVQRYRRRMRYAAQD